MVDGFCTTCKREVAVDDSLKCPTCGRYVDPLSLATVPKPERAVEVVASTVTDVPQQTVTLPESSMARKWGASTDALIVALEREEAEALAAFEAAKIRAQNARRAASAMRKLRSFVHVGTKPAKSPRRAKPALAALPPAVVRKAEPADAPKAVKASDGRWSREYDACTECGRTEVRHAARGLCFTCYSKAAKSLKAAP